VLVLSCSCPFCARPRCVHRVGACILVIIGGHHPETVEELDENNSLMPDQVAFVARLTAIAALRLVPGFGVAQLWFSMVSAMTSDRSSRHGGMLTAALIGLTCRTRRRCADPPCEVV